MRVCAADLCPASAHLCPASAPAYPCILPAILRKVTSEAVLLGCFLAKEKI